MAFFKTVGTQWTGMLALTGAFLAGAMLVGVLFGFRGLPEAVEALDTRVTSVELYVERVDRLVCMLVNDKLDRPVEDCEFR